MNGESFYGMLHSLVEDDSRQVFFLRGGGGDGGGLIDHWSGFEVRPENNVENNAMFCRTVNIVRGEGLGAYCGRIMEKGKMVLMRKFAYPTCTPFVKPVVVVHPPPPLTPHPCYHKNTTYVLCMAPREIDVLFQMGQTKFLWLNVAKIVFPPIEVRRLPWIFLSSSKF